MEHRRLIVRFTRWLLRQNWLAYREDVMDTAKNHAAEIRIAQLIQAFEQDHVAEATEKHYRKMQRDILLGDIIVSPRQLARINYLGALIAVARADWDEAMQRIDTIITVDGLRLADDPILRLECDRWLVTAALNSHNYRIAFDTCNRMIEFIEQEQTLAFVQGDGEAFRANLYFLRSVANFGLHFPDASQRDLLDALEIVQDWIGEHAREGPFADTAELLEAYEVRPPVGNFVLPLHLMLPNILDAQSDPELQEWVELYHKLCWQLAMVRMWIGRLEASNLERRNEIFFEHKYAAEVMASLIDLCTVIPFLRPSLGRAATLHAEILLSRCDFLPQPWLRRDWEPLVSHAEALLKRSDKEVARLTLDDRHQHDMPTLVDFLHLTAAYQRARLSGDLDGLAGLVGRVKKMYMAAFHERYRHLAGRCNYLLGRIEGDLGHSFVARRAFHRAALIFAREGNEVRAAEARRARDDV